MSFFGRKKINFQTEKQSSSEEKKRFIIIFAAALIIVLSLSLVIMLGGGDGDLRTALGGDAETETVTVTEKAEAEASQADHTYLVWSGAKDRSKMSLMWLFRIQMPERKLSVCSVLPDTIITMGGKSVTFEEIYSKGAEKELVAAVEAYAHVSIDRYFGSTDDNFKAFINYLGGVDVNIPDQIEYRSSDFNLILVKGRQNVKGDTLFKYLMYLGRNGASGSKGQSETFIEMLRALLSEKRIERRSNIFSKITNSFRTNATIVDFSAVENNVGVLMKKGFSDTHIAAMPGELSSEKG